MCMNTLNGIPGIGDNGIRYNSFMPLTIQEVEHIASLARLELSADEKNGTKVSSQHEFFLVSFA